MGERLSLGSPASIARSGPSPSAGGGGGSFSSSSINSIGRSQERFSFAQNPDSTRVRGTSLENLARLPKFDAVRTAPADQRLPKAENPFDRDFQVIARAKAEIPQAAQNALDRALAKPQISKPKGIEGARLIIPKPAEIQKIARQVETQAKKPALIAEGRRNIQTMAARAAEKAKNYIKSIDFKDPMTLLEAAETARAVYKIAGGGGMAEIAPYLASTALIKGIEMAAPAYFMGEVRFSEQQKGNSSMFGKVGELARMTIIHEIERKVTEKLIKESAKGVMKAAVAVKEKVKPKLEPREKMSPKVEAAYHRLRVHPETKRIVAETQILVQQGLTHEQVQAQMLQVVSKNELGLQSQEMAVLTQIATKKWLEVKNHAEKKEEEKEEEKKEEMVAELDPEAQAERKGHLKEAIDQAPVYFENETTRIRSEDITKKLPYQEDKPKIISEAKYWVYALSLYKEPDGSWPQSMKEIEAIGWIDSKGEARRKMTAILEKNIPIRWRKKSAQTQKEADKKQVDLVYARLADEVAREAALALI